jgi:2-desacetyl-2-hydroxyethyl bacteriochlorophyllide A dehydrogenase
MVAHARREARWWIAARSAAARNRVGIVSGQAIVWTEPGRTELLPIDIALAGPGEVTIDVLASVVSPGTERAQYLRLPNTHASHPHRPGFSASGVVRAVGPDVRHVSPGDRVAVGGISHASVGTVPAARVYSVADGVALEEAAAVNLGVIAEQAVRLAEVETGERACIIGAGFIGALVLRIALAAGAGETTAIATSRKREAGALRGGAGRYLVNGEDDEEVAGLSASVVVEASGDPQALRIAISAVGEGGRIVLLGSPRGRTDAIPVEELRRKRITLIGAHSTMIEREGEFLGTDLRKQLAETFLQRLAAQQLKIGDLLEVTVDPHEPGAFYRTLARGELLGAWFDWSLLGVAERAQSGRLVRRPDLSARGVDYRVSPIRAKLSRAQDRADPFAHAKGHLRVGLLGCGDVALHNAAAVAEAPNTELVACYDPVLELAQEIADRHGCEISRTAEELIERNDVDAVFLAVPHHLHAPLGIQAAASGRHLIVEKPPANDLHSAVEMVRAAEQAGVLLTVHFPTRFEPEVTAAKRLIEAGAVGEFQGAIVRLLADRPPSYWIGGISGRSTSTWRSSREKAGGGVLIMNLPHYVDLVRHLTGVEADSVFAATASEDSSEVEDAISATVRYANGAIGSIFGSTAVRGTTWAPEVELWGSDGHVVLGMSNPQVWSLRAMDGIRASSWHEFVRLPEVNMRAVFVSRFATAVHLGEQPDVGAADALAVQAFIEAAYRSSELGQHVRPEDLLAEAGR